MFTLNAAVMLTVGVLTLIRPPQSSQELTILTAALLFIDSALLAGCAVIIAKRQRWSNLAATAVLLANILLTVFDDFGLPDLIVLALLIVNLVFLSLLIRGKMAK